MMSVCKLITGFYEWRNGQDKKEKDDAMFVDFLTLNLSESSEGYEAMVFKQKNKDMPWGWLPVRCLHETKCYFIFNGSGRRIKKSDVIGYCHVV